MQGRMAGKRCSFFCSAQQNNRISRFWFYSRQLDRIDFFFGGTDLPQVDFTAGQGKKECLYSKTETKKDRLRDMMMIHKKERKKTIFRLLENACILILLISFVLFLNCTTKVVKC